MSLADWCGLAVAVDVPPGGDLLQPHQVPVLDQVHDGVRVRVVGRLLVPHLDHEDVVFVLVGVGSYLLLLGQVHQGVMKGSCIVLN